MPIVVESSAAVGVQYILDAVTEDASNVELALVDNIQRFLIGEDLPAPPEKLQWASSVDTEGSLRAGEARHENRTATITIRLYGSSESNLQTMIEEVSEKVEKLRREGGTLQRTLPSGDTYVLDILAGSVQPAWDRRFIANWRIDLAITFTAAPYWRTAWRQLSDHTETTNPCIAFTETTIKGDVPALGRLVVDNDATSDQLFLIWGQRSRNYSSASTAALFYEAEGRTLHSGSTVATLSGSSGGASNNAVRNNGLTTSWQSVLSTGALTHIGTYRVWARVYFPQTSGVDLRLSWGVGDFLSFATNDYVALNDGPSGDVWTQGFHLIDLGLVTIPKVRQGTQAWEGRIEGRSDIIGGDVYVDCLFIVPVDDGYGEARAVQRTTAPTSLDAHDEFNQSAGALSGKTAAAGGAWASAGDATDFAVEATGHTAWRAEVSDVADTGRFATLGSTLTACTVAVEVSTTDPADDADTPTGLRCGALARYTNTSNWMFAALVIGLGGTGRTGQLVVRKNVAGTKTTLASSSTFALPSFSGYGGAMRVTLAVTAGGVWSATLTGTVDAAAIVPVLSGTDSALATGGGLASGKGGMYDENPTASSPTRTFDNITIQSASGSDAAVFANQSLEVRYDGVIREDSGGTLWARPGSYRGDYLLVQPAGSEGRTSQFFVKMSRADPGASGIDSAVDDLSARLWVAERFVHVPE